MKVEEVSINQVFLSNRTIKIPYFQRPYVWNISNWEKFYNDIAEIAMEVNDGEEPETYFMGSIILKRGKFAGGQHLDVIDGQQRLSTIVIFMKALYLSLGRNDLFMKDFMQDPLEGDDCPILVPNHNDKATYFNLIHADVLKTDPIDNSNMGEIKLIKENYQRLRNKLGRIPALADFDAYGEMDVACIFRGKLGSYHNFLVKYEKEYTIKLNEQESKFIEFVSCKFAEGKRPHELELLSILLSGKNNPLRKLEKCLQDKYAISFKQNTLVNMINIMTGNFATGSSKGTFADCVFLAKAQDNYEISERFAQCLQNPEFKRMIQELVKFGLKRYNAYYMPEKADRGFKLYQKYDYEDVCRILEWSQNVVPLNIGGYKYDSDTNTYPVFINYDKAEDISDTIAYHDRFQNNAQLIAISKGKRTMASEDVRRFLEAERNNTQVDLFVRKNKDDKEAKSFYYLGRMTAGKGEDIVMESGSQAVEIFWNLETPVREDIYEYITSEVL